MILDQVAFLVELAAEVGVAIRFLKPHGALYNQAQRQHEIARGVVDAAAELGLPLLGQPGTLLEDWPSGGVSATSPRASPTAGIATTARSSPGASRMPSCTTPPRWPSR